MSERYELKGQIGQGGIGTVHKAFDTQLKREVAIKRLIPSGEGISAEAAGNLIKEATTLSALQHPNIVTVYDVGTDDEGGFVVMELLKGETFDQTIDRGALTFEDFKNVVTQTLEALIAAHHVGLIHRDLKPSNLMVNWMPSGKFQIKILDFGLAKFSKQPSVQTIDQGDAILGSIYFMAPEQFERIPLDARTDLYSMGCMYYQCLTGKYPFDGDTAPQVMASHLQNRVTPLQKLRPDVPQWACDWVMWLISRSMEDRPESAKAAYARFQDEKGSPAHEAAVAAATNQQPLHAAPAMPVPVGVNTTPLTPGQPVAPAGPPMQAPFPGQRAAAAPAAAAGGDVPPTPMSIAPKPTFPTWAKISIPILLLAVVGVGWMKFSGSGKRKETQDLVLNLHNQIDAGETPKGNGETVDLLYDYMIEHTSNLDTTRSVMRILGRIEGDGVDKAIVTGLDKLTNPTQLQGALVTIGEREYKGGIPGVMAYATHDNDAVRNGAFDALAKLAGKDELATLLEVAAETVESTGRNPYKGIIQALALKIDGTEQRVVPIIAESEKHNGKVRGEMLHLLGQHGGERAWKAIDKALNGGDEEAKMGALRALAEWPDSRPSARLFNMAKNESNTKLQLLAVDGYIRNLQHPSTASAASRVKEIEEVFPKLKLKNNKKSIIVALGGIIDPAAKELAESLAEQDPSIATTANNAAKRIAEALEKVVMVEDEIYLEAEDAQLSGLRYNKDPKMRSAVDWEDTGDTVSWPVRFKEAGSYAIYVTQSSTEDDKDTYEVSVGDEKVAGEIIYTEEENKFKTKKIGQVDVDKAGGYTVVVKATLLTGKTLMNLKQVRLKKVE